MSAVFASYIDVLEHGRKVVVNDEFLDWLSEKHPDLALRIRTVPNPKRVGILDQYVATLAPANKDTP